MSTNEQLADTGAAECIFCEEHAARPSIVDQEFVYRDGGREVVLHAQIPVIHCEACDEIYTAAGAEEAQHEAVCAYLGRLSPTQIRALRERLHLSQARLAEMTQIGIASIKRWETGSCIQNASLDARLRALDLDEAGLPAPRSGFKFRFEPTPDAVDASRIFSLRSHLETYAYAKAA